MMQGHRLLALLFLISGIPTSREASFIATSPKVIRPGIPYKFHVKIMGTLASTNVGATLESKYGTKLSTAWRSVSSGRLTEIALQTPREMAQGQYKLILRGTGGLTFQKENWLACAGSEPLSLIQLDRGMYAEMENIKSRIVVLYPTMRPYNGDVHIKIYDSKNRLVFQHMNQSLSNGVTEQSFAIPNSPNLGTWKIEASVEQNIAEKTFVVRKYVVPKFSVSITCDKTSIDSSTRTLTCTVKSRYTYGKDVKGTFRFQAVTMHGNRDKFLKNSYGDITGQKQFHISWTRSSEVVNDVKLIAQVGDSITGTTVSASHAVRYKQTVVNEWTLEPKIQSFKPGLPLKVYIKFSSLKSLQLNFEVTELKRSIKTCTLAPQPYKYKTEWTTHQNLNVKSVQGYGVLELRPDSSVYQIDIAAYQGGTKKKITLPAALSRNQKLLTMIPTQGVGKVGRYLQVQIQSTQLLTNSLSYQVIAQGRTVAFGEIKCKSTKFLTTSFSVTGDWYPRATIVVSYLSDNGDILADSQNYEILGAPFMNYVTLMSNVTQANPKENVRFDIGAKAGSTVYLLSVDEGITTSQGGFDITQQEVYEEISQGIANSDVLHKKMVDKNNDNLPIFEGTSDSGTTTILRNPCSQNPCVNGGTCHSDHRGNFYCSCTKQYEGRTCKNRKIVLASAWGWGGSIALVADWKGPLSDVPSIARPGTQIQGSSVLPVPGIPQLNPVTAIKKLSDIDNSAKRLRFPKTWVWDSAVIGKSSSTTMLVAKLPDSMTTWVTTAFSINADHGIGFLQNPNKITVSKDFFVETSLPESANAGSYVAVRILLFNNRNVDEFVQAGSRSVTYMEFQVPKRETGEGAVTVVVYSATFQLMDYVQKTIAIKAPGLEQEYNIPKIISSSGVNLITLNPVKLTYPSAVVKATKRVYITLTGDALAPSIDGLESLIRLPTGCGEQTMMYLAPNIYVLNYLSITKQLASTFENKAVSFINKGKDREMTWRRSDGSFSVWGNRDSSGSTWLTAFVMTCFHQALKYIDIEDSIFENGLKWLLARQRSDGSFAELGKVIHYDMKGGVHASRVTLASYILLTLLENDDIPALQTRISTSKGKVVSFILSQERTLQQNKHGLALTAYALLKAGRSNDARRLYNTLETHARKHDGYMYWTYGSGYSWKASDKPWSSPNPRAKSIDIETTAYALLYLTLKGDVGKGMAILKWLVSQRNPYGGFSSTQDTVVSLHALSEFVAMKDRGGPMKTYLTVDISYLNAQATSVEVGKFTVSDLNRKLVQRTQEFSGDVSSISVKAKGKGFVVVDIVVKYNVETTSPDEWFDITTNVPKSKQTFDSIMVNVCVSRRRYNRNSMVVVEVGVPCGFKGDLSKTANNNPRYLKHTETGFDKVVLYFDRIGSQKVCMDVVADRIDKVTQSEDIPVVVYDYYEPVYQGSTNYTVGLLKEMNLCSVCKDCSICSETRVGR